MTQDHFCLVDHGLQAASLLCLRSKVEVCLLPAAQPRPVICRCLAPLLIRVWDYVSDRDPPAMFAPHPEKSVVSMGKEEGSLWLSGRL